MLARILIHQSIDKRMEEIHSILVANQLKTDHPDLLLFKAEEKMGVEQARKIVDHFSLKPYSAKGRAVVIEDAGGMTLEAQNALLKTLEEPPEEAILILGAGTDANFLPTILSRCEVVTLTPSNDDTLVYHSEFIKDLDHLVNSTIEERFEYVEKLKEREEFLHFMTQYFRQNLYVHPKGVNIDFLKELLQAEQWVKANVNIRGILEYLMLVMPSK